MKTTRFGDKGPVRAPASAFAWWEVVLLCVVLLVTAAIRLRLLDVPFERDEGESADAGQLLLQGVPPTG